MLFVCERRRSRSRCSRRRSAGGDGGTTLYRSARSDEDGGSQRTSQRAERAIKHSEPLNTVLDSAT